MEVDGAFPLTIPRLVGVISSSKVEEHEEVYM